MNKPGGPLVRRPLHFIWIADCSGAMAENGKIQALNNAIKESIPSMQRVARQNPFTQILMRVVRFSDGAHWHIAQPTQPECLKWPDLTAEGQCDLGAALKLVAAELKIPPMPARARPPVLALVLEGYPTDNVREAIGELLSEPWGRSAVRIGILIGANADMKTVNSFIANPERKPLQANNAETLIKYIKWASTAVLDANCMSVQVDEAQQIEAPRPDGRYEAETSNSAEELW